LFLVGIWLSLMWTGTAAADWPQWLGPSRNGTTVQTVAAWNEPPKVLWRQVVGTGFSSPVVSGDKVFMHTTVRGANEEEVLAFDVQTGDVVWRDRYPRAGYGDALGAGPRATPTIAEGRLQAAKGLMRICGYEVDGSVEDYYQLGHDIIPFVSLIPR
jgi:outer membrane protein assembly factor BamB